LTALSLDGAAHIMKKTKPVGAAELDHLHAQFLRQLYAELWRRNSSTHSVDDGSSDARRPDPHDGFDPTTLDLNAIHDLITRLEDARERRREEAREEVEAEQQQPGLFDPEGEQ
jgi:hypothetical protein